MCFIECCRKLIYKYDYGDVELVTEKVCLNTVCMQKNKVTLHW